MSAIVPRCFSCSFLAAVCPALSSRIVSGVSGFGTRNEVLVTTSTERVPPQQLQVAPMSETRRRGCTSVPTKKKSDRREDEV